MVIFLSLLCSYNIILADNGFSSLKHSPNLSQEEYEEYINANPNPTFGGKVISIQKRYTSKNNVPVAVEYSEYTDEHWWSGVLKHVGDVTIDSITGHHLAIFEGKVYK